MACHPQALDMIALTRRRWKRVIPLIRFQALLSWIRTPLSYNYSFWRGAFLNCSALFGRNRDCLSPCCVYREYSYESGVLCLSLTESRDDSSTVYVYACMRVRFASGRCRVRRARRSSVGFEAVRSSVARRRLAWYAFHLYPVLRNS